jgi:hypothetical protein
LEVIFFPNNTSIPPFILLISKPLAGVAQYLIPIVLATHEAEVRKILVPYQSK